MARWDGKQRGVKMLQKQIALRDGYKGCQKIYFMSTNFIILE